MAKNLRNIDAEPWKTDFWPRVKNLTESSGKKRVAYIYEIADTSTFRYRVYNMCQALEASESWAGSYFFESELKMLEDYLDGIDLVIFSRTMWSDKMGAFLDIVKKKKTPTLYDIDDLVFNVEKLPLIMSTLNVSFDNPVNYDYWFSYASRLWLMAKMCDGTIGTNRFLCDRLSETFAKPSFIVNNFMNNEQIKVSEKIYEEKTAGKQKRKGAFKIGYFSGTPSHINDFKEIAVEMRDLLQEYPEIRLEVVGFMDFPEILKQFVKKGQIKHSPLVDFLTLQKKVSEADVNLVPLVDNEFTNCKSELKFFEAAIVGTVTCATPTYVYRKNIQEGKTGFLCEKGQWRQTVEAIYNRKISEDVVKDAREYCLAKYSPEAQLPAIERALNQER